MKTRAQLYLEDENPDILFSLLTADEKIKSSRSKTSFTKEADKVIACIEANDVTALRASVNGVLKIAGVYEKTKGVIDDEQ